MKRTNLRRRTPMKKPKAKKISAEERKYAAWLRKQHCTACERTPGGSSARAIEAAHTGGLKHGAGTALKSDWRRMIPLCKWCHTLSPVSYHTLGEERWLEYRPIDLPAVIERLRREYEEQS